MRETRKVIWLDLRTDENSVADLLMLIQVWFLFDWGLFEARQGVYRTLRKFICLLRLTVELNRPGPMLTCSLHARGDQIRNGQRGVRAPSRSWQELVLVDPIPSRGWVCALVGYRRLPLDVADDLP